MPSVRIEIADGHDHNFLRSLIEIVADCLVDVLQLLEDDKNIRLIQYSPDLFLSKSPYEIFIEIFLFSGRSAKIKKILYKEIVNKLSDKLNVNKNTVFIILNEQPKENWGIRGGIGADEIELGFNIDA